MQIITGLQSIKYQQQELKHICFTTLLKLCPQTFNYARLVQECQKPANLPKYITQSLALNYPLYELLDLNSSQRMGFYLWC